MTYPRFVPVAQPLPDIYPTTPQEGPPLGYYPGLKPANPYHIVHGILTLVTLGLWAPIWALVAIMTNRSNKKIVARYNAWAARVRWEAGYR